jgi:hypothetical protein
MLLPNSASQATCRLTVVENPQVVVSRDLFSADADDDWTGTDASWVIEQAPESAALPRFGTVSSIDASAVRAEDGIIVTVMGADTINFQPSTGPVQAVGSIDETASSVTIVRQ